MTNILTLPPEHSFVGECKKCTYCDRYESRDCSREICHTKEKRRNTQREQYKTLVDSTFSQEESTHFRKKASHVAQYSSGDLFLSVGHRLRFLKALHMNVLPKNKAEHRQIALLFLLTAQDSLWDKVKSKENFPCLLGTLKPVECATAEEYALFQIAKHMAQGKKYPDLGELARESLISMPIFAVIVNGLLLEQHGSKLLTVGH